MKTYDLYGLRADDIETVREAVEAALEVKLIPHESSYIGDYYLGKSGDEEFQLRKNSDPIDGEPVEDDFPKAGILLYVNKTQRAREIEKVLLARISGMELLARKEL
jgi:hypothetical protein